MKFLFVFSLVVVFTCAAAAQKADDVLATATGHSFRLRDLSETTQKDVANLPGNLAKGRTALLDQLINQRLVGVEAKSRGISIGKLLADEKSKVPAPTDAEVKKFYDENLDKMQGAAFDQAKDSIVRYLRSGAEQKNIGALLTQLKTKYKVTPGKDVNAPALAATDVVATVGTQAITAKEYEDFARIPLYEARTELAEVIVNELHELIYDTLLAEEAKSVGIDASALVAREITDKLKNYTDAERDGLERALENRLYTKYQVKTLYLVPEPPLENVSVDDDPAAGPAAAPVTVIMFSDFQCSACAATHPVLKQVIASYPGKVKFVVRDFPLESIHPNGFQAARAAGAANAQGKFFEYTEILYKNQTALDDASLKKYAAQIGLNAQQFEVDFNSEKIAAEVRKDMADGDIIGVNSTPTIFVNGRRVLNLSANGFKTAIDRALAGK
jgi:protein-disulfide isomerase